MASYDPQTLITFYARKKYYRHVQSVCDDARRRMGDNPVFQFWKLWGQLMEGDVSTYMSEFSSSKSRLSEARDIVLCSLAGLIYAHKQAKIAVDVSTVNKLTRSLEELTADEKVSAEAHVQVALYYWFMDNIPKAQMHIDIAYKRRPNVIRVQVIKAWLELLSGGMRTTSVQRATQLFQNALQQSQGRDLEALMGAAKFRELQKQVGPALENLTQVIGNHPWFVPALSEKARLLLMAGEWDQAFETATRAVTEDSSDIESRLILLLQILAREGHRNSAKPKILDLLAELDKSEPKNPDLYYNCAKILSRIVGRDKDLLSSVMNFVDRARSLDPGGGGFKDIEGQRSQSIMSGVGVPSKTAAYVIEAGHIWFLQEKYSEAARYFRAAIKLDESSVEAAYSSIWCLIIDSQSGSKQLADADAQISFLNETQTKSKTGSVLLSFLTALMQARYHRNIEKSLEMLNDTQAAHWKVVNSIPYSMNFFITLDPEFTIDIAKEYLTNCPDDPPGPTEPLNPILPSVVRLLTVLTHHVPGSIEGLLLLARVKFVMNELDAALSLVNQCLYMNQSYSDAYLLLTRILLHQERFREASEALEQALSHDFSVRDSVLYHLITAQVNEKVGNFQEALRVLERALALEDKGTSLHSRASVYLQLARVHAQLNHKHEASEVIAKAQETFINTSEEGRVVLANADILAKRGEIDKVIGLLRMVTADKAYFVQAKARMAQVYLHQRMDRQKAIKCWEEIVKEKPSVHTRLILGDAYMRMQEPEKAIQSYHEALKVSGNDANLASKMGRALVVTHDYKKAVEYYRAAASTAPARYQLKMDLARLYLKLGAYKEAEAVVLASLNQYGAQQHVEVPTESGTRNLADTLMTVDLEIILRDVEFRRLLAEIYQETGNTPKSTQELQAAREAQTVVVSRMRGEGDQARIQVQIAGIIAYDIAQRMMKKDPGQANKYLNEALRHDPTNTKAVLELAKLHLKSGEDDSCQTQCANLLRMDPGNEEASMMMADLMFRKNEHQAATFHFQQLLEVTPTHYVALERLIGLLRRAGCLQDVTHFLTAAEESSPKARFDAGLHYCKALQLKYLNNPRESLKEFNIARKDGEWGVKAVYNMIDIYLFSDDHFLQSGKEKEDFAPGMQTKEDISAAEKVEAARKLLQEIPETHRNSPFHRTLDCHVLILSKTKPNIEESLRMLLKLLNEERDYVPALYAMSAAYAALKQLPKARNQLKRISTLPFDSNLADDFERSWLLLADIYTQGSKYDLATVLLKKCLQNNKSCGKAFELLGYIMEKEQAYIDAAEHYERAWSFMNQSSAQVGFKLAFTYLKAKRYVEALDVCHKVLQAYPEYPKIRKEVLLKAQAALRP